MESLGSRNRCACTGKTVVGNRRSSGRLDVGIGKQNGIRESFAAYCGERIARNGQRREP